MNSVVAYGRSAFLVVPGPGATPLELALSISARRRDGVVDVVPAAETVLVVTDGAGDGALERWLEGVVPEPTRAVVRRAVEIDVCYDGEDLEHVAAVCGLPVDEVIALHSGAEYRCEFCGFAPGFGYLSGLDAGLELRRRSTPRVRVPAGSIAIAGPYTAAYPTASPGGWHLIGRTEARLWDVGTSPPALLAPGTTVRFRPVDRLADSSPEPTSARGAADGDEPSLVVVSPGIATTVQDGGRGGYAAVGLASAGAVDAAGWALANRLVGNHAGAAAFETAGALVVEALRPITVADSATGVVRAVAAGERVVVGPRPGTAWAYLAVRGGLAVEPVLGSRSRDTLGAVGPPAPVDGAMYEIGADPGTPIVVDHAPPSPPVDVTIRLDRGPRHHWFTSASIAQLTSEPWRVGIERSRVGVRLDGPALRRTDSAVVRELPSEGLVRGAVQVPPDGHPVVMLADHPVTGGYPVIAVVHPADLSAFAQLPSGTGFRFTAD